MKTGHGKLLHRLFLVSLLLRSSCGDLQHEENLCTYGIASRGLGLPQYIQRTAQNDVTIFYYDSDMISKRRCPEWLRNTDGQHPWEMIYAYADYNSFLVAAGFDSALEQFNRTGPLSDVNIYQFYGCCHLHPDGKYSAFLSHSFNGNDFLSFDTERKEFSAVVPQAVPFMHLRNRNEADIKGVLFWYMNDCRAKLNTFKQSSRVRRREVPEVRIFQRHRDRNTEVTCHVTGFYPRFVKVDFLGPDLQPVNAVSTEVLPNEDETYQTRRIVLIPEEDAEKHSYTCVVHHSSVAGNITKFWEISAVYVERSRIGLWILLVFLFCLWLGKITLASCWWRKASGQYLEKLCAYGIVSEGFGLPKYIQRTVQDDVTILYYDSDMLSKPARPEWLNNTEEPELWNIIHEWIDHNIYIITAGYDAAVKQFNRTGSLSDGNIYQFCGCCYHHPDGKYTGILTHSFNGKDFLSLDTDRGEFIAVVPQAVNYMHLRNRAVGDLDIKWRYYSGKCKVRMNIFKQAPKASRRDVPEVRILNKLRDHNFEVTCHVTGFYPRPVQVVWLRSDLHPVNSLNTEVLPNGDKTYQTRMIVVIPEEDARKYSYTCVVHHSSVAGNITKVWVYEQRSWFSQWIFLGFIFLAFGFICWCCWRRRNCSPQNYPENNVR